MKKENSLKSILAILVIILLCLVSFGGIYVKDRNVMKNWLPEYTLGMDTGNYNIVKLNVEEDKEESTDSTSDLVGEAEGEVSIEGTEENTENVSAESTSANNGQAKKQYTVDDYKKTKAIIEKRLKLSGVEQYTLRLDEATGSMVMEFPEDANISVLNNVFSPGKVEFKIEKNETASTVASDEVQVDENGNEIVENAEENATQETEKSNEVTGVIADKSAIKDIKTSITQTYADDQTGYTSLIRMDIEFTSDAVKKFKEIRDGYVTPVDENGNIADNTVKIYLDDSAFYSGTEKEFLDTVVDGVLPIRFGDYSTDTEILNTRLAIADSEKAVLTTEILPVSYNSNYSNIVHSNISKTGVIGVFAVLLAAMCVYLVIKYKLNGLFAELSILGFAATLLLVLRWTSVQMSVASLVSIAGVLIAQFIYLIKVLNSGKSTSKAFNEETISFTKMIVPAFILGVVAALLPSMKNVGIIPGNIFDLANFGMVIFWAVIVFEIFNNILTRAILTNAKNK